MPTTVAPQREDKPLKGLSVFTFPTLSNFDKNKNNFVKIEIQFFFFYNLN